MSTLSGIVSKGEKGKSKFQSLDINSLYGASRGESLEQHQQKNTLPRKHGMQSLGKVPSARRPPVNLPSLKSEYSSSDPASNSSTTQCVAATTPASTPSQEPSLPGQQQQQQQQQQNTSQSPHTSEAGGKSSWSAIMSRPGDAGGAPTPPHQQQSQQQQSQQNRELNAQYGPGPSLRPQTEGSWIQGGSRTPGAGTSPPTGSPGGGSGVSTAVVPGPQIGTIANIQSPQAQDGTRPASLVQSAGTATVQAGQAPGQNQQGGNFHHYRGLIPQFMCRGNFPPGGFPSQFPSNVGGGQPPQRPRFNNSNDPRQNPRERPHSMHDEEMISRPIIKEEDLTRMDDISHEPGWAAHDDIDYNQKLAFSDDENDPEPRKEEHRREILLHKKELEIKMEEKQQPVSSESAVQEQIHEKDSRPRDSRDVRESKDSAPGAGHRTWQPPGARSDYRSASSNGPNSARDSYSPAPIQIRPAHSVRGVEDEEIWTQRRKDQADKITSAVERARQRKEEEEKRFQEQTKQAAAKKLQDLENKIKQKSKVDDDPLPVAEVKGIIIVPPVLIPVPEWERDRENRDRENRERSRTSSEGKDDKQSSLRENDFASRTNFMRQQSDSRGDRDMRDRDQPAFSRQFQNNLPPRFQKQQAERGGVTTSSGGYNRVSPPSADRTLSTPNVAVPFSQQYDLGRWSSNNIKAPQQQQQQQQQHGMMNRRNRADSDHGLPSPVDEDPRPREHHQRGDRFRTPMHHSFDSRKSGYHDDYNRGYKNDHEDRHQFWERERGYDEKMRDMRMREFRDRETDRDKDYEKRDKDYDKREKDYDKREKDYEKREKDYDKREKDYDKRDKEYEKRDKEYEKRDKEYDYGKQEEEPLDWAAESRRGEERVVERREERVERSERPQRPDSRDSRASRESRTSLREDDHKITSWAHEMSDYEEKRQWEEYGHRDRDRRAPPGPITREKLQEDVKSDKRNLTQLKRLDHQEKKETSPKEEAKKDKEDSWSRKLERTPETTRDAGRPETAANCAWADAVSPTFEKDEEKIQEVLIKEEKESPEQELKESLEKMSLDKELHQEQENKEDKRDKNLRNRTNSGSSSRGGRDTRVSARTWGGGYNMYSKWRGPEPRGRRGGSSVGSRSMGRPGSAKSGSYGGHTDSEISGDEVSSTAEGKEDRRSGGSKVVDSQKSEKDERNRDLTRREDKRADFGSMKRPGYDSRPREGFAPSGEPSRRGRGAIRVRGTTSGGRMMEGYGPPPSKSPFSSDRTADDKQTPPPAQVTSTDNETSNQTSSESADDNKNSKMMIKQEALTAGITGRRNKSPNPQSAPSSGGNAVKIHPKKDDKVKRTRSGSRRRRENRERVRSTASTGKQNSDAGNEEWETTSENSEEHGDDHKESRKPFRGSAQVQPRRNELNNREKSMKSAGTGPRPQAGQLPDKRGIPGNSFPNQRNHFPQSVPGANSQNGRPRSQGSAHSASSKSGKETTVNRVDEIKLNDANLVDQALKDIGKKPVPNKEKKLDIDGEMNNYLSPSGGDDGSNSAEDQKLDTEGFQEVRSKKNLKDSSRHSQKDEKPPRRDKENRERDRSKSKSNGAPVPAQQNTQNIPPLLGQPVPQPANLPQKPFDRNSLRQKLAPRFQKQKLARQQAQQQGTEGAPGEQKGPGFKDNQAPAPPSVNAWDKPFTSQMRANSPSSNVPADVQLMSGLTGGNEHQEGAEQGNSSGSSQRNSPSAEKAKAPKEPTVDKNVADTSSPPVQTLIFENTNYSKTTKTSDMAIKSKFSNHMKRVENKREIEDDGSQLQQPQQSLAVAFASKLNELKEKPQEPIQMPLSFNKTEDNADMKLDFTFDADLSQLTEDKTKSSLGMPRSMHMTGGHSTISPSTAELNLKIASVKKVWENAPMPTVVEHEDGSVVSSANSFPQTFETADVDDSYSPHQQYNQGGMKNEITTSTNVCKVKPQQQSSGGSGAQTGSTVPGPSPIGPGQSPIGHPPASIQAPLSPPPFNSTGQPSHMNYPEFPQYPGSQAAQYGSMSAIPSPPAVLFNTGSGQLPAQAGGLYGAFQLDQSRSPFTQYPPYAPSLQSSYNQQNVYLQQPPPPPHAQNAPTPDMYQSNLSQYRIPAAAAPPFGQNQQLSNNPNTVLISSSSNSLMSASVKPSSQPIGAIGTKGPHFQAQSAPQPNQLTYIPYDPSQVLGVSGNYMGNSQLVQRPGPSVQQTANSYYSATSADVFPGSQTGFYQPGGAAQQTGTPYGLQGFGQHSQSLGTPGNATPVGLQNFSSQFLSGSGLQIAAAAAAQQFRNPTGGLPGPANAAATFLSKHQQQEQPRQLKSPSGNQQDVLASVFSSTPQIPSPKSRNCKQPSQSQQPQPSPTQHHKYPPYQGVSQSAMVSSYSNYNVRGMGMPPRGGIQPSQQRYPPPIQRPVVPFPPGPNPNNPNQQQQNCMPNQQQQNQMNRHRPNIHQQQQRNMKMQQQYYSGQGNVKIDPTDKNDTHNDKITDSSAGNQPGGNKTNAQQEIDTKEEVNQQAD